MLGLGETDMKLSSMKDLRALDVDMLTLDNILAE